VENNRPPNIEEWYNNYDKQIKYIADNKIDNKETIQEWYSIRDNNFHRSSTQAVPPLLKTTWNQECYYNASCPVDASGPCGHCPAGCAATAMAQIMKYWKYPTKGTGSNSYTQSPYGTLSADFGATTYNWGSMPNNVTSPNTAVATLMYHCGVGSNMKYGTSSSGTTVSSALIAFINYFNYPYAEYKSMSRFTVASWINILKSELNASRPVLYAGANANGADGHSFVCDGYDNNNNFHFNWGWSGDANGYYAISSLTPSGKDYSYRNLIIIRIKPPSNAPIANFGVSTITPVVGSSVNFTDNSKNNPTTWLWTFEGGTPATSTSQNPTVTYNSAGKYLVALTVTNASGSDTKTREMFIDVGGMPSAWIMQNTGFANILRCINQIFIVNPNVVWATAFDGTNPKNYIREFTRTINGGMSWTPGTITFTGSTNYMVSNIFAFSDATAFVCMAPITGTGGVVAKTTDGGITWSTTGSPAFTGSWANLVHFFNANDGICMGDPTTSLDFVIYTTTNGGSSWTQVPSVSIPKAISAETGVMNFYDVVGNTLWFGTSKGRVYKSTDKGLTWTVTSTGLSGSTNVRFKDANTGLAILKQSPFTLKKTTDGGATWNTLTPSGYFVKKSLIDFIPSTSSTWVNVSNGPSKGSSYSIDDCTSFLNIDTGSVPYSAVTFYDINTGWAGDYNTSSTDGGIWKCNTVFTSNNDIKQLTKASVICYPNPSNSSFTIQVNAETKEDMSIRVSDLLGKNVYEENNIIFTGQLTKQIELNYLQNGIYFVNIMGNNINYSTKIIIQR
ncbi:MAG: C10 family peptidase, partial [Bacteroidota bacterium]